MVCCYVEYNFDIGKVTDHYLKTVGSKYVLVGDRIYSGELTINWLDDAPKVKSKVQVSDSPFCVCNGSPMRCDTGFSFSKVYYVCSACKKEKK